MVVAAAAAAAVVFVAAAAVAGLRLRQSMNQAWQNGMEVCF